MFFHLRVKFVIVFAVMVSLLSGVFFSPTAFAQTRAEQLAQIQMLLQIIEELQAQLAQLQAQEAAVGGQCPGLSRTLSLGSSDSTTGGEVSKLQRFLTRTGHYNYGEITGYFGPATEQAVQAWQAANGVVSAGSAQTTGYGVMGPASRAKVQSVCSVNTSIQNDFNPSTQTNPSSTGNPDQDEADTNGDGEQSTSEANQDETTTTKTASTTANETKTVSLLKDETFSDGFLVKDPQLVRTQTGDTHVLNGVTCPIYREAWTRKTHELNFENKEDGKPASWAIAQWSSQANLYPSHGFQAGANKFGWSNWYKNLVVDQNNPDGHLTIGIRGDREFQGVWGNEPDPCFETGHPHLYLEQAIDYTNQAPIGQMQDLLLNFKSRVTENYITPEREAGWNENIYTAHLVMNMSFQNMRPDKDFAQGHGQSFGIGINLFDVRNRDIDYRGRIFVHKPRQRIILYIALDDLSPTLREELHSGQWGSISDVDILPYVKQAFAEGVKAGKNDDSIDRLVSEDMDDYYLTNFNFGFEVSSLHHIEMEVSDVSLQATY